MSNTEHTPGLPMANFILSIKADSGYRARTEGRCTHEKYSAVMAVLHGQPTENEKALKEALRVARGCILTDRTTVADCGMDPVTNQVEPEAAEAVADYDAILAKIDAALQC